MKRFTSEKAFTLVEMSVVLSVVALIGSLLVGGVVTVNNNRVSADVLEFFDKEIEEANENFKLEPQKVLKQAIDRPEPYLSMSYSTLGNQTPGFQYMGYYAEDLTPQSGSTTGFAKYQLIVRFEQEFETAASKANEVEGFSRNILSFHMKAMVVELVGEGTDQKYDYDNPMLERVYRGISVDVDEVDLNKEKDITVTYKIKNEDQNAVISNLSTGTNAENTLEVKFAKGDHFYSQKVTAASENGKAFVGWAENPTSRDIIPAGQKITGDMTVYAVFSEYRLEFQLAEGQQFSTSVIPYPDNKKNFYIEREFSDFPEDGTTIGDIPETVEDKWIVEKLLDEDTAGQVLQVGYTFTGWRNAVTKQPVSESLGGQGLATALTKEDPYLQLEAVMEKLDKADKIQALELSLDLTNYQVGDRKFFVYGITDLEYAFSYDTSKDTLILEQKEYNTWNGEKELIHTEEFVLGEDSCLSIVGENNAKLTDFKAYIQDLMEEGLYIQLDRISLNVNAPKFDSSTYRDATGNVEKDTVYLADTNVIAKDDQLASLDASAFQESEKMKYQTMALDEQATELPLDEASYDALNEDLLSWHAEDTNNRGQVEVLNMAGAIELGNGNDNGVYTTKYDKEVSTTKEELIGSREISFQVVVPLSLVDGGAYKPGEDNFVLRVRQRVDEDGYIRLQIRGKSKPLYSGQEWIELYTAVNDWWENVNTGIPYKETYTDSNGTYTVYNRISTVEVIGDISQSLYTVESDVAIVEGNGPTADGWFPKETGLNEVYNDAKIQAVKVESQGALGEKKMESGYCKNVNRPYCQPYVPDGMHLQLNQGLYTVRPVPLTNWQYDDAIYILSSSFDKNINQSDINNGKIPYVAYSGTKYWEDFAFKAGLKNNFVKKGGNEATFEKIWPGNASNQIMIGSYATHTSTEKVHMTHYSFNNEKGGVMYTSLPKYFECR